MAAATQQTIRDWWFAHPNYWIAIDPTVQAEADTIIYTKFYNYDISADHWIDQVIFLDQFTRHFSRAQPESMTEEEIDLARVRATEIVKDNTQQIPSLSEQELVFCLMPFKHIWDYDFIFPTIHERWLPAQTTHPNPPPSLTNYPLLTRFYKDTYEKHYANPLTVAIKLQLNEDYTPASYNPDEICDYCPPEFPLFPTFELPLVLPSQLHPLADALKSTHSPFILSLSGGVDSMVMCYLLNYLKISFMAVHIIYGNRTQSEQEYAFIKDYCRRLHINLYVYRIEWLRRHHVDREFYEEVTRNIRFTVYGCIPTPFNNSPHVLLGHIQDDIVENIWTNLAHATHLHNLAKMSPIESYNTTTTIHRPWLNIKKSLIYEASNFFHIPYLKNTTPSWSNRGKFRETFYKATHDQFGESVDTKIIEAATSLAKQSTLIDKLLYTPVFESWNPATHMLNVTRALEATLDGEGWSRIFTHICHTKLHISKPSIHACRDFAARISSQHALTDGKKFIMKKDLTLTLYYNGEQKILHFEIPFHSPPPSPTYSSSSSQSEEQ
jgi:tRNA(Ile)-lysidine synthetase-like protein